jgi:hypothetical protein
LVALAGRAFRSTPRWRGIEKHRSGGAVIVGVAGSHGLAVGRGGSVTSQRSRMLLEVDDRSVLVESDVEPWCAVRRVVWSSRGSVDG